MTYNLLSTAETALDLGISLEEYVSRSRKAFVEAAVKKSGGNLCKAARLARSHRNTISRIHHDTDSNVPRGSTTCSTIQE